MFSARGEGEGDLVGVGEGVSIFFIGFLWGSIPESWGKGGGNGRGRKGRGG